MLLCQVEWVGPLVVCKGLGFWKTDYAGQEHKKHRKNCPFFDLHIVNTCFGTTETSQNSSAAKLKAGRRMESLVPVLADRLTLSVPAQLEYVA